MDDRVVVKDPEGSIWARFYEIGSNRPIFVGRDGVVKYSVAKSNTSGEQVTTGTSKNQLNY